jgi:uncharacterized protein (DUF427 family)
VRRPERPSEPGPGQESVWDYPRPPRVERSAREVVVVLGGVEVCRTSQALRVLETSHPPVWYLPVEGWHPEALSLGTGTSYCEFKGTAVYMDVTGGDRVQPAAGWQYPEPEPGYEQLLGAVAVYPGRMDRCTVDGEVVGAQEGGFYGGWVTGDVVGPFKGAPGTRFW